MKKLFMLISGLLLMNPLLLTADVSKVGTTAVGFLNIDVGARAVGMGGAYVAVADGATSMFWNPSGIADLNNNEAVFHHSSWLADIKYNYLGAAFPVPGLGTIGLNATALTMDEMEKTTRMEPEGTGEMFSAGNYAFGLTFARSLTDRFAIGFNFKYLNETIYHSSANGVAFDVGTIFTTQLSGMKIGMSICNYGPKVRMSGRDMLTQVDLDELVSGNNENLNANLVTDAFNLPLMFRVGVSMDVLKGAGNSNLILAIDAMHPNDDVESINLGAEYLFNGMFALRGGYSSLFAEDSEAGLTFGAGFNFPMTGGVKLTADYAYKDFGLLENVQMFTLGLRY